MSDNTVKHITRVSDKLTVLSFNTLKCIFLRIKYWPLVTRPLLSTLSFNLSEHYMYHCKYNILNVQNVMNWIYKYTKRIGRQFHNFKKMDLSPYNNHFHIVSSTCYWNIITVSKCVGNFIIVKCANNKNILSAFSKQTSFKIWANYWI